MADPPVEGPMPRVAGGTANVTQLFAEVWVQTLAAGSVVVTQLFAEVWVPSLPTAPPWRRQSLSSQAP